MSDETNVIQATADACRQARLFGCTIDVEIAKPLWGTKVHVVITPHDGLQEVEELDLTHEQDDGSEAPTMIRPAEADDG